MTKKFVELLQTIKDANSNIVNMSLITADGLTVAILLPGSTEGIEVLRTAVLISISERLLKIFSIGTLTEIVVSMQDYCFLIMPVSDELYAGVLSNSPIVETDKIRLELSKLENLWISYSDY